MVFLGVENSVARVCFIEGMSVSEASRRLHVHKSNVSRARQRILGRLRVLGIDPENARSVADAVAAILRRQESVAA